MFRSQFKTYLVAFVVIFVSCSFSFAEPVVEKAVVDKITAKMKLLQIEVSSVSPLAVDGLYELLTDKGIFYISKDMRFLIDGDIYDFDKQMENISAKSFAEIRKNRLKAFESEMIVYKAPHEKHVITVFTDTSCGYCRKLHKEMADYNKLGITVRYLAFPRGGLNSSAYNTMVSVWCADDQKLAMDNAKKRGKVVSKTCKNSIKEQYELGLFFGVNGTPAIILQDGTMKPGYVPAERLAQMLQ
jgi:thiol:disulfide interchange protein DsbC